MGNVVLSELSSQADAGMFSFFYYISGGIFAGFCYNLIQMFKNKKSWNNQNIIVEGEFKKKNCFAFFLNCLVNIYGMNIVVFMMYFANQSVVNVGVIMTITSLNTFLTAYIDYLVYKVKLGYHLILGMIVIVVGGGFICLSKPQNVATENVVHLVPTWIPVVIALFQTVGYTVWAMLAKHLTSERIGFDALNVTFTTIFTVGVITTVVAIVYFHKFGGFNQDLMYIGFVGSFFDTLGIVFVTKAFSCGPAGLIAALCTSGNILLTIIEAIRK